MTQKFLCFPRSVQPQGVVVSQATITSFQFTFRSLWINRGTLLVAQLSEALRYKPEGRGVDSRCCQEFFIDIILPAAL
jgi:hypothetical protein